MSLVLDGLSILAVCAGAEQLGRHDAVGGGRTAQKTDQTERHHRHNEPSGGEHKISHRPMPFG